MSKKSLPRKVTDIKGKVAIGELRRAHWIIVVLSLALVVIISLGASQQVVLNGWLAALTNALLLVVAIVSFGTAVRLR